MNGLSGSDINTGWKPVTLDEKIVPTSEGTPTQHLDVSEKTEPASGEGVKTEQPLSEILTRLREIHWEILSLRQLVSGLVTSEVSQEAIHRRKLRRKRILKFK